MKRILLALVLLFSMNAFSQNGLGYANVDLSFDPNTAIKKKGLDFDVEVGAAHDIAYAYMYYGRFENAKYQNYGAGVDMFLYQDDNFDLRTGLGLTVILRKQMFGRHLKQSGWGSTMSGHARVVGSFRVTKNFALTGRFQYQHRPDIDTGIVEGSLGIAFRFYRNIPED